MYNVGTVIYDTLRHHLYEHNYCHICQKMTFEQQMDDVKQCVIDILRNFPMSITERSIINEAKGN